MTKRTKTMEKFLKAMENRLTYDELFDIATDSPEFIKTATKISKINEDILNTEGESINIIADELNELTPHEVISFAKMNNKNNDILIYVADKLIRIDEIRKLINQGQK